MEFEINLQKLRESGGLFLGIPMYGGLCYGSHARSLMDLAVVCAQNNILLRTYFLFNESLITRARSYIADEFLRSDCNTMIFIDSDIDFSAKDVLAMWHLQLENKEYDIICGPYPKKTISWEKIKTAVDKGFADKDPKELENFVGDYVFSVVKQGNIKLSEPAEVLESGTGFMMIRRNTFEVFKEAYPELRYKPDHARQANFDGSRDIHLFFQAEIDPESRRYLSEDYWFCQKARKAGLKTWICPWMQLKHNGSYTFKGSLGHIAAVGESISYNKKEK